MFQDVWPPLPWIRKIQLTCFAGQPMEAFGKALIAAPLGRLARTIRRRRRLAPLFSAHRTPLLCIAERAKETGGHSWAWVSYAPPTAAQPGAPCVRRRSSDR